MAEESSHRTGNEDRAENGCPTPSPPLRRLARMVKNALLFLAMEAVWALHAAFTLLILPLIVGTRRQGELPQGPCILCVTHVGEFDPYFVIRATRRYRMRALFERDGPEPIARFLLRSMWRFRVSQHPDLKPTLNKKTMREVVAYLSRGGVLMVFPEGYRHWEKRLYPGAAVLAHRAGVPVIPVGIEHGQVFRQELVGQTFDLDGLLVEDVRFTFTASEVIADLKATYTEANLSGGLRLRGLPQVVDGQLYIAVTEATLDRSVSGLVRLVAEALILAAIEENSTEYGIPIPIEGMQVLSAELQPGKAIIVGRTQG